MDAVGPRAGAGAVANKAIRALNADAQKNHSQTMGRKCRSTAKAPATQEVEHPGEPQVVEFPWISLYSKDATRLSAGFFRVRTGWRRDEWAESPLFICGKSCPKTLKNQGSTGVVAAKGGGTRWR
jgi:hypothetical protein